MDYEAKDYDEILNSIKSPILRQIKEFDLMARCNPTSFRSLLFSWFQEDQLSCKIRDRAMEIWAECKKLRRVDGEPCFSYFKEIDRLFRFKLLHHYRLLGFWEYESDWLTLFNKGRASGETVG